MASKRTDRIQPHASTFVFAMRISIRLDLHQGHEVRFQAHRRVRKLMKFKVVFNLGSVKRAVNVSLYVSSYSILALPTAGSHEGTSC